MRSKSSPRGEHPQEQFVVAEHDVGAVVDDRHVAHLQVRVARVRRHHRRLEGRGVAHLGVAVAGRQRAGRAGAARRQRDRGRVGTVVVARDARRDGSSGSSSRARFTLPPPMCVCRSMPPAITTMPRRR